MFEIDTFFENRTEICTFFKIGPKYALFSKMGSKFAFCSKIGSKFSYILSMADEVTIKSNLGLSLNYLSVPSTKVTRHRFPIGALPKD